MKRLLRVLCAGSALAASPMFGQANDARPEFEVASIKPAPPMTAMASQFQSGKVHFGMHVDGARVDIGFMSLRDLIVAAYRIKAFQVSGPDWMMQERFDVVAKLPEGASTDQVPEMLQTLLAERFKLVLHRENKEHTVYALVVGKNGSKLKESVPDDTPAGTDASSPTAPPPPPPPAGGANREFSVGTPTGPMMIKQAGRGMMISGSRPGVGAMKMTRGENGAMRMEMPKITLPALADMLTPLLDRPVVDMTELKGTYQVALEIPMEELMSMARLAAPGLGVFPGPGGAGPGLPSAAASDQSGGSIFAAIQRLGLKLEPRKAPLESIVIDHLEKAPTEN